MPYKIALDGENLGKTNCIPFFLQHHSDNLVRFVDPSNADYIISIGGPQKLRGITESSNISHDRYIYILVNDISERDMNKIRYAPHLVDQHIFKYNNFKFPIFTHLDLKNPLVINVPLGFSHHKLIQKPLPIHFELPKYNPTFNKKVYWRGGRTHQIRRNLDKIILSDPEKYRNFYFKPQNTLYELSNLNKVPENFYNDYFKQLKSCDFVFNIRGDLPWTFSFWDILRSNSIPINVNCMYEDIGFENVGVDINKLSLNFDTQVFDEEYILEYMLDLYTNSDLILSYKEYINDKTRMIVDFFKNIYDASKHLPLDFWKIIPSWFIARKILDILKKPNNFNNKVLCRDSLKI